VLYNSLYSCLLGRGPNEARQVLKTPAMPFHSCLWGCWSVLSYLLTWTGFTVAFRPLQLNSGVQEMESQQDSTKSFPGFSEGLKTVAWVCFAF
jgi:hypothetical protein